MTVDEFRRIRAHVLAHGDRLTWCNMYNCNPHLAFDDFDVFFNPDIGQRNINCDPARSGFDVMIIRDQRGAAMYFEVRERGHALEIEDGAEPYIARILAALPA